MNAAPNSPLPDFLAQVSALANQDRYEEIATAYSAFVTAHPHTKFMATEPIPALVGNHLIAKTGKPSAFNTFTLRTPTWADQIRKNIANGAELSKLVKSFENQINAA